MSVAREIAGRLADQVKDVVVSRGANYGPPEVNFANIAGFWRAWIKARHGIDVPLDGHDVGQMSALIKKARLAESPTHEDSALDDAIYTMLGHGCAVDAAQPLKVAEPETLEVDSEAFFGGVDSHMGLFGRAGTCEHGISRRLRCYKCVPLSGRAYFTPDP